MSTANRATWEDAHSVHTLCRMNFPTYEAAARHFMLAYYADKQDGVPLSFHRPPTWFSWYRAVRGYSLREDVLDYITNWFDQAD